MACAQEKALWKFPSPKGSFGLSKQEVTRPGGELSCHQHCACSCHQQILSNDPGRTEGARSGWGLDPGHRGCGPILHEHCCLRACLYPLKQAAFAPN